MPTPSTRTPVRIARGSYSNLNGSVSDLQDGEISYAEDQNKLYVKEGSSLVSLTFAPASPTFTGDVTFTGAANNVVFDASDNALEFADSAKAIFGAGGDLEISHTGVFSLISNTGDLVIRSTNDTYLQSDNNVLIGDVGNNEVFIKCIDDGAVELYNNNVKTCETQANGIIVLGPEGGHAEVLLYADEGDDNADKWRTQVDTSGNFKIGNYSTGSWVNGLTLNGSNDATFAGAINTSDNKNINIGNGGDLKFRSNGSKGIVEGSISQVATAVSALDLDLNTSNYFTKTISGNSTFTFSNPAASGQATAFTLELTHSSGTVTWPSSVKWNADTAPALTTGKTHLFMFVTDDGGTRYRGSALVDYVN